MFNKKTVFILGAGASWYYGYPTGEGLVKKVIDRATHLSRYFAHSREVKNGLLPQYIKDKLQYDDDAWGAARAEDERNDNAWKAALAESEKIKAALTQTNPLVIDYFLGWNPDLRSIGTLLVAWVILECEKRGQQYGNINRGEYSEKDNWCRFVIHQLAIGCKKSSDLLENDVTFVTFNYDISLELMLRQGLQHIQLFEKGDVEKFFTPSRVLHVYGAIRSNIVPSDLDDWAKRTLDPRTLTREQVPIYQTGYRDFLNKVYAASRGLRVIDPDDKETDKAIVEAAQKEIARAKSVYILGYGFDKNNSARLGLRESFDYEKNNNKSVFFTNLGDINRVNKRVSKLIFGRDNQIYAGSPAVERTGNSNLYERSVRDVYEALELDFESFE